MDHLFLHPLYDNNLICFLQSPSHYLKLPCLFSQLFTVSLHLKGLSLYENMGHVLSCS